MALLSAADLLAWLGANFFIPAAQVEELRGQLAAFADGHALGKELIRRNWLSPYQINHILQGEGDSLIVGANRLLERIGEGAMGQVFKAWNTRLGRVVAVKMIHKEHVANQRAMDRFQREMKIVGQLDHPNIVLVRDAGESAGRPYLVMDFVDGIDLSKRVKLQGPLGLAEAVRFAHQAALGLQHAYERGVVHRDIKPGNLLLTKAGDGSPLVKIFDFGLSRLDSDTPNVARLTHAGNLIGTVDYIAPEQAQDARTADVRADIYSLGCTLFYLLTGQPPFAGSTVVEKVAARTTGPAPSAKALRRDVPAGLDQVLQRMMAREPEQRYPTPLEAAQALEPFTRLISGEDSTATFDQADVAAAIAQRKFAPAIPVTLPMPAGVPIAQALPVSQPMPDDVIPVVQATPVALTDSEPLPWANAVAGGVGAGLNENLFAGSTEPAAPSGLPMARPVARTNNRWLLWGGGATAALAIVVIVVVIAMRGSGSATKNGRGYGPDAALTFKEVEPAPMTLREGRKTPVIVTIQRKDFSGPVTVSFENLPVGLQSTPVTIKDRQDRDQLYLMASFNSGLRKADLVLSAVAENVRAEFKLPVTIVSSQNEPISD